MARAGAARVFFDIVGTFQANKLIKDTATAATVQQAIFADAAANIADSFDDMASAVLDGVGELVDVFHEYEQQLVRVRKFYGGITEEADRFAESTRELGLQFGFSGEQALAASARTAQLKNVLQSQEAIIEATRAGLLMAAVGEMETEMGMNRLINLAQQTGFMMGHLTKAQYDALTAEQQANVVRGNTLRVLDQLNTVENSSVATMEDITFVLNQFSSQANIAGESIGEMAAMSALLLETGEEVSRAGTGLRMIYQRIGNENTQAVKVLQELMGGVDASAVTQMKLTDIIKEIGPAYANMTAEQKRNLAVSIAGSRHYVKFLKLMENQPRLLELQEDAYAGVYDAIGEFENRAESAFFSMEQLQGMTKNLQADIGEDLAEAYLKATEHTYHFYNALQMLVENDYGKNTIENIIQASGLYQNLVRPIADVGFQAINMFIAFKTLTAVQKMSSMAAHNQKNAYMQLAHEIQFLSQTNNAFSAQFVSKIPIASAVTNNFSGTVENLKFKLKNLHMEQKYLKNELKVGTATMGAYNQSLSSASTNSGQLSFASNGLGQSFTYSRAAVDALTDKMIAQEGRLRQNVITYKQAQQDISIYAGLMNNSALALTSFNALQSTGNEGLLRRNNEMNAMIEARKEEHSLMNNEMSILVPLTNAEKNEAMAVVAGNNAKINNNRIMMGNIRAEILRLKIKGEQIPAALQAEMTALQEDTIALQQNNLALEQGIMASNHAKQATEEKAVADKRASMTLMQKVKADMMAAKSSFTLMGAMKGVNRAMMPAAMIMPFLVDSEKQMSMMISAMVVPALMRAIIALKAQNAEKGKGIVLSGMLSGGLSLVAAGAAMVAGMMLVDALIGDKFLQSPLDNLNEFNDGLETMESRLAKVMASDEPIMAGIVDATMEEIKNSPDALRTAKQALKDEIESLSTGMAGLDQDSFIYGDMKARKKQAEEALRDVEGITDAMNTYANLNTLLSKEDSFFGGQMNTYEYDKQVKLAFSGLTGGLIPDVDLWTTEDHTGYNVTYADEAGRIYHEQFESKKEALEFMEEVEEKYGRDALEAQKRFLDTIFLNEEEHNEKMIDSMTDANEQMLGEMFGFANAREELFFGQRQNFTGALYKQVSQGGIENLLHKTEIIQTNVFNGMTLPEMISQVADGVRTELRNSGVPGI